jgi:hypothetical protein
MNLLIVNGLNYPTLFPNPSYRGTHRTHPTYCDKMPPDHEINKLFMWFLEEGGELGIVHDLSKARRYAQLCNTYFPDQHFEVVEVTDGETKAVGEGQFLGYDISAGYNDSLLWWGLKVRGSSNLPRRLAVLCDVVEQFFSQKLNQYGLFQDFWYAALCREALLALQSFRPGLYEGGDLNVFQTVGIYLL